MQIDYVGKFYFNKNSTVTWEITSREGDFFFIKLVNLGKPSPYDIGLYVGYEYHMHVTSLNNSEAVNNGWIIIDNPGAVETLFGTKPA